MHKLTSRILVLYMVVHWFSSGADVARAQSPGFEASIKAIIGQLNQGSSQAFSRAVSTEVMLDRALDGLDVDPGLKAGFSDSLNAGVNQLGETILKGIPEGTYGKVVSVRDDGDRAMALVRYGNFDRGFRYHDYELGKDEAGNVRIVDWFDYLEGHRYSFLLRQSVVTFDPTVSSVRGLVPAYQGSDADFQKFAELIKTYRDKNYQRFFSVSATLPRQLRRSRYIVLLTCQVSRMAGDQNVYIESYRALANQFGDDPKLALILLNYYFSRGDYEEVSASLRVLQETFEAKDAAILSLMSRTALGTGNPNEATLLADEAIMIEPELESAYWAAIDAHVALENYSFAVMTAKSMEEQFGRSLGRDEFEDNDHYSDFIKSSQYKRWQAAKP